MPLQKKTSRRRIIKAGLASAASLAVSMPNSYAAKTASELKPKAKGETKVVFLGGFAVGAVEFLSFALSRYVKTDRWRGMDICPNLLENPSWTM